MDGQTDLSTLSKEEILKMRSIFKIVKNIKEGLCGLFALFILFLIGVVSVTVVILFKIGALTQAIHSSLELYNAFIFILLGICTIAILVFISLIIYGIYEYIFPPSLNKSEIEAGETPTKKFHCTECGVKN